MCLLLLMLYCDMLSGCSLMCLPGHPPLAADKEVWRRHIRRRQSALSTIGICKDSVLLKPTKGMCVGGRVCSWYRPSLA